MKKTLMVTIAFLLCLFAFAMPAPEAKAEPTNSSSLVGLYAGSTNPGKVWEYKGNTSWESITDQPSALGWSVTSIVEFEGKLYAATISDPNLYSSSGKVYRYEGGKTWTPVVSGLTVNQVTFLVVYKGNLYAGTATPARLYKYDPATIAWTKVLEYTPWFGFRSAYVWGDWLYLGEWYYDRFARWEGTTFQEFKPYYWGSCIYSLEEYQGSLYAGAYVGRLYRVTGEPPTATPIWGPAPYFRYAWSLKTFKDRLYIGFDAAGTGIAPLYRYDGTTFAQVWSYSTTTSNAHEGIISMATDGTYLYLGVGGQAVGYPSYMSAAGVGKVYRTSDGVNFEFASGVMGTGIQVLYRPEVGIRIIQPGAGKTFLIEAKPEPRMPTVNTQARVAGITPDPTTVTKFTWEAECSYKAVVFTPRFDEQGRYISPWDPQHGYYPYEEYEFKHSFGPVERMGGEGWSIDFRNMFCGGNLTITVKAIIQGIRYSDTITVFIKGENPSREIIKKAFAAEDLEPRLSNEFKQAISFKESSFRQFYEEGIKDGMPLYGSPGGYGLMQIDVPPNYFWNPLLRKHDGNPKKVMEELRGYQNDLMWNWMGNIKAGLDKLIKDESKATQELEKQGKPQIFSQDSVKRQDMFERNVASRYHSDRNYYRWNAVTGRWEVQDHAGIGYADRVMEIKKDILEGRL